MNERVRLPAATAVGLAWAVLALAVYRQFDFRVFYDAGQHLLDGHRLYPSRAALALETRTYYVYPPFVAFLFAPLALLPYVLAATVYATLNVAALLATLRVLGVRDRRCYLVLLLWMPVLQGVGLGTIGPFLALLLALAWRLRDRAVACGIAVAVAVAAKLFLWPLGLWLLATRRWRAAGVAVAASLGLVFVPWALLGFRDLTWYPHALRLLLDDEGRLGFSAATTFGPRLAPLPGVVAVAATFALAQRADGDRRALGASILAALLLSPLVWIHYFVVLVVPIALARRQFHWLWAVPALGFWPIPNDQGHPWVAAAVLAVYATAAVLAIAVRLGGSRAPRPRACPASPSASRA